MSKSRTSFIRISTLLFLLLLCAAALPQSLQAGETGSQQLYFKTPEEAVQKLLEVSKNNDIKGILTLFGPAARDIFVTSNPAKDKEKRENFYALAEAHNRLEKVSDGRMLLVVGTKSWPFPCPLVKDKTGWRFDTAAGIQEILNRRIGEDELQAIAACQAYVAAQWEYFSRDREGNGIRKFAQKLKSSEGKKDGLYWPVNEKSGEEMSPLGPFVAKSEIDTVGHKRGDPFYGYYFRILTRQGPNVPGGAYNYIINGNMIAGFALVAYPEKYGSTGVTTFVVNQQGEVFEKDLGPETSAIAGAMTTYNPDRTWTMTRQKLAGKPVKAKK